ncbi:alpha/beta fold hydrolase [Novosphingobium sp.]|uniref:alpha/beta fold hydrolase n=1 Tax=Novosphingobium sp. TaxID=1874826 RepID=UPI003D0D0DF5
MAFSTLGRAICRIAAALALCAGSAAIAQSSPGGEEHTYEVADFHTESGSVLPHAKIVYGTYGTLNAAGDNVILVPSHYMATWHGYDWLIGKGRALDPARYFIVATEMFGNGRSSSPSNTPEPFHGPRFPVTTIRDNVEIVRALLKYQYGVTHVRAIIGFSMGGQQAFQWAISHPDYADRIVATSSTAKTYGHGIVRLESQIAAIEADPVFANGDYKVQPAKGIEAFNLVWTAWLYSQEWWRRELWRVGAPADITLGKVIETYRTKFIPDADANDLILQMRAWQRHDISGNSRYNGQIEAALRSIRTPILYMPSLTDLYFPVEDARYEARLIPGVTFKPIPSLWGHPAGAGATVADDKFINEAVFAFLAEKPKKLVLPRMRMPGMSGRN